jgi:hypothetical protein
LVTAVVAAPVAAAPPAAFSGSATGLALSLEALLLDPEDPPGFTAGLSAAEGNAAPSARARGAGDCQALAPGEDFFDLPCTDSNTEEATAGGADQSSAPEPDPKCSSPAFPEDLAALINAGLACGNAEARTTGGEVLARGSGEVGRIDITLPDEFEEVIEVVVFSAGLGLSLSSVVTEGTVVEASASADGGAVGFFATDLQDPDPLTNGLIIIDIGSANAQTSCEGGTGFAQGEADPALVSIRFKTDPQSQEYTEVALQPGETQTILPDTPFETTIVAADGSTTVDNQEGQGSATAQASAVDIHALKGITAEGLTEDLNGGLRLRLSETNSQIACTAPAPPPPLAPTGDRSLMVGLGLLLGAVALALVLRPRFHS